MAYVYRHIRLDKNEPFYIGIGNDRFFSRAYRKTNRNKHWLNIVGKTKYDVEILLWDIDYNFAKIKEREFINLYGRQDLGKGTLVNYTDGGEGNNNWSPEKRQKFIERITGRKATEETRKRQSESHKGYKPTKETLENMRIANIGKIITKETREKMASKLRGRLHPEWQRKILSEAAKGKKVYWIYVPIYHVDNFGNIIKEYESITQAAKELSLHAANIGKVLNGNRKHTGGFIFKRKTT